VMPVVTSLSGQAISGAIDNAISSGFSGSCQSLTPNGGGVTYCFDGDVVAQSNPTTDPSILTLSQRQRVEHDLAALGYAGPPAATKAPTALPPRRDWLAWIDVRGTDFSRTSTGNDFKGTQVNGTGGITYRFTPDFLIGVLGGYEHFNFTSQAYNGVLKGDGATAGAYMGWRLGSSLRFDAGGAWSAISADGTSGAASGKFTGHR